MSNLVHNDEKGASVSDRRRGAAIPSQERQARNVDDGGPPGVSSTTASHGPFCEQLSRDSAITDGRVLLHQGRASRGAEERSAATVPEGSSKNQRFDLAYEKYYSASSDLDQVAASEKALFSKAIISVDKSTRGVQRPEKCKDYQPRCSSADNFSSNKLRTDSTSASTLLANLSKRPQSSTSTMPAAVTCPSADPATTSKLTSSNANFSLPPSPQRSSSSSTSDGGSSTILAMAKRLHRLRLAAASPNRNNNEESIAVSKESIRDQEFISIEPLATAAPCPIIDQTEDNQMPQISTNQSDQRSSAAVDRRQTPSTTPSLSDVSIASFYRLPPAQTQTSDAIAFQRQMSSSSLGKAKVWTSEPILVSQTQADTATAGQHGALDDFHERIGRPLLAGAGQGNFGDEHPSTHLDPGNGNPYSARFSALISSFERNGLSGAVTDGDGVQERRFMEPPSWQYPTFPREPFPVANVPDAFGMNAPLHTSDLAFAGWSRANAAKDVGSLPAASLPPLPPGRVNSRNGLSHPPLVNNGNTLLSSSNTNNGEANSTAAQAFPDSISRLMEAVSRHPASELDYSKLKTILREQRKSYKRRLEREKAKREALEDLLVKLNATPRVQHRSFSNASSTTSTVRNVPKRQPMGGNGRSSADLGDVIINSIRSSSIDGNSTTTSEDAFLLELIQQHLRMKQALIGHLGKRTTGSSSASGGEQDGRDHGAAAIQANDLKLTPHSSNGADDDDIPMGGEAASGAPSRANLLASRSARLPSGQQASNPEFHLPGRPTKSRSMDLGQGGGLGLGQLHGLIDKDALKLMLDTSSTGGSENGARSSSSERRKQRRRWETNSSVRSDKNTEREQPGQSARTGSGRTQGSARPSVAFFVPADVDKGGEAPPSAEIKDVKPLPNVFRERQLKFIQRSMSRQDKIKAASELRSETARRIRELADNVAHGRMRMEDANEQLLLFELPQPSAFSRVEMFKASKLKYEQLPETVARRNKMKKEADLATNRVMAKMFKQKMAFKRLMKKSEKQGLGSSVPSSVVASNGPPSVRLLNR